MADENDKVILWSAGVSATRAALAGLLAQRATTPLSKNPWFILCASIACFSFAVLLFAGLYAVCDWWRDRIRRKASSVAAEHPVPAAPAVSADDLTVNVDKQATVTEPVNRPRPARPCGCQSRSTFSASPESKDTPATHALAPWSATYARWSPGARPQSRPCRRRGQAASRPGTDSTARAQTQEGQCRVSLLGTARRTVRRQSS